MPTTSSSAISPAQLFGEPKEYLVQRKNDRDLAFNGWRIGHAQESGEYTGYTAGVEVSVFLTKGKTLVTHVRRWEQGPGKKRPDDRHTVGVHRVGFDQSGDAVQWLKDDDRGRLGSVSKNAWVDACRSWPELKSKQVERVD